MRWELAGNTLQPGLEPRLCSSRAALRVSLNSSGFFSPEVRVNGSTDFEGLGELNK